MTFKLILAPEGSVIPDDLAHRVVKPAKNIVERIMQCKDEEMIVQVTTTEIQMLVEYRNILDVSLRAIIGLHGSTYNTIWNTYVSTLPRTTIDNLRVDTQQMNEERSKDTQNDMARFRPTRVERPRFGQPPAAERTNPDAAENSDGDPDLDLEA